MTVLSGGKRRVTVIPLPTLLCSFMSPLFGNTEKDYGPVINNNLRYLD